MSKNEKLDEVFNLMKKKELHKDKKFIPDGIIDEVKFNKAKTKILFFNKEAYTEDKDFDLRNFIKDKGDGYDKTMFQRLGAISYCIFNSTEKGFPSLSVAISDEQQWYDSLCQTSIMNIKKSSGLSSSREENLSLYSEADKIELKQQIQIINPEIIILGNIIDLVEGIIDCSKPIDSDSFVFKEEKNRIIINFLHPAWFTIYDSMYYYTFAAIWFKYITEYKTN